MEIQKSKAEFLESHNIHCDDMTMGELDDLYIQEITQLKLETLLRIDPDYNVSVNGIDFDYQERLDAELIGKSDQIPMLHGFVA